MLQLGLILKVLFLNLGRPNFSKKGLFGKGKKYLKRRQKTMKASDEKTNSKQASKQKLTVSL